MPYSKWLANSETLNEGSKNPPPLTPPVPLLELGLPESGGRKSSRQAEEVEDEEGEEEEGGVSGAGEAVGLMFELLVFKLSKEGSGV